LFSKAFGADLIFPITESSTVEIFASSSTNKTFPFFRGIIKLFVVTVIISVFFSPLRRGNFFIGLSFESKR
jgi:hypothetical protein